jgi:hypothetical protein
MAIITDYTNSQFNAYATTAEIDEIIVDLSPFSNTSKWDALDEPSKEGVIKNASQNVNCFAYKGVLNSAVISPFNMQFPRIGLFYTNGTAVNSNEIPFFVKQYVAERCLEILDFGPSAANGVLVPSNVKKNKVGSLEQEFFSPKEMTANQLTLKDFSSYQCTIKPYVLNSGNTIYLKRA